MRQAMAQAPVGDDVYGEDPSINELQELAAQKLGKEAGLFVPSGTMGNLVSILAQCTRGDEVILGKDAHTFLFEAGGISALGGIHSNQIPNQKDGTLDIEEVRQNIRSDDPHYPTTRLLCLENTHNRCGGVALSLEYTKAIGELAQEFGLKLHLDGARIFNAAVANNVTASQLAEPADSVTFCLSKGLCAPVGSVICGNRGFINTAHRIRKQLGGGMRQAGIIGAAGIIALESMTERLVEDHIRAKRLAQGLGDIPGLIIDPGSPYTNMVFLTLGQELANNPASRIAELLANEGVLVGAVGQNRFRLVTHYWIDDEAVDTTVAVFNEIVMRTISRA